MSSYSLRSQARCLEPLRGDEEHHAFLVGTCTLRGNNEIRLLRFYEEDDEVECSAIYNHPDEILSIAACPFDFTLIITVHRHEGKLKASIWRLTGLAEDEMEGGSGPSSSSHPRELQLVASIPVPDSVRQLKAIWFPSMEAGSSLASVSGSAPPGSSPSPSITPNILTVDDTHLRSWCLQADDGSSSSSSSSSGSASASMLAHAEIKQEDVSFLGGLAWDPHHPHQVAVAGDSSIRCWDLVTGSKVRAIENAVPAGSCIRGLSFNPNKPWHLASAGDDHKVCVWDLRKAGGSIYSTAGSGASSTAGSGAGGAAGAAGAGALPGPQQGQQQGSSSSSSSSSGSGSGSGRTGAAAGPVNLAGSPISPVKVMDGHSHWASCVAFNPFHDQLLLSGGCDGRVNLWRLSSISSAPLLELGEEELDGEAAGSGGRSKGRSEPKLAPDAAIGSHEDHDDSVYSCCWSASSAWVYASLSYPGKVAFYQVPSAEKYKILL